MIIYLATYHDYLLARLNLAVHLARMVPEEYQVLLDLEIPAEDFVAPLMGQVVRPAGRQYTEVIGVFAEASKWQLVEVGSLACWVERDLPKGNGRIVDAGRTPTHPSGGCWMRVRCGCSIYGVGVGISYR